VTGYGLDGRDLILGRSKVFLFSTATRPALRPTQAPIHWVKKVLLPEVKRPGREADHLPPFNAQVTKDGVISALTLCRHGIVLN
jgi:hypothetical protein